MRFVVSETSGYKPSQFTSARTPGNQPRETEVMVMDSAYNFRVIWRRYHTGRRREETNNSSELRDLRVAAARHARALNEAEA